MKFTGKEGSIKSKGGGVRASLIERRFSLNVICSMLCSIVISQASFYQTRKARRVERDEGLLYIPTGDFRQKNQQH